MAAAHLHLAPRSDEESPVANGMPIRVVLADDHAMMRRGLRRLLDREQDVKVIAEAADLGSALESARRERPHVLVLDLGMPDGSSIDAIGALRERIPETQVVVITMQDSPVFAQRAFAVGAVGFVAKDLADGELPQAIRAAARGQEYISPRVAVRLDALHSRPAMPAHSALRRGRSERDSPRPVRPGPLRSDAMTRPARSVTPGGRPRRPPGAPAGEP
jgi:DNA-binding NarL/FixJ family response regulator